MNFPVSFEFKVAAFSPQFSVKDSHGRMLGYVKQKLFKLKEDVTVYADSSLQEMIYKIKATAWLDWSASYVITDRDGKHLGRIGRKGARSIWKATYEIFDEQDKLEFIIQEENPFVKVADALLVEIPFVGIISGLVFNPKYKILRASNNNKEAVFSKNSSFFGKSFTLDKGGDLDEDESKRVVMALMMMVLLERARG